MATTTHSPTIKTAKKFKAALAMCCFILRFLHRDARAGEGQPDAPPHRPANAIGWSSNRATNRDCRLFLTAQDSCDRTHLHLHPAAIAFVTLIGSFSTLHNADRFAVRGLLRPNSQR
jgi:hypothetical protein